MILASCYIYRMAHKRKFVLVRSVLIFYSGSGRSDFRIGFQLSKLHCRLDNELVPLRAILVDFKYSTSGGKHILGLKCISKCGRNCQTSKERSRIVRYNRRYTRITLIQTKISLWCTIIDVYNFTLRTLRARMITESRWMKPKVYCFCII